MREWRINEDIHELHRETISKGVIQHGQALSHAYGGCAEPITCLVMDDDVLIGGVTGRTEFGRLFINYLWVDTRCRKQGLGAELLHRIEALALQRGCLEALIESLDEHVASWYERCGYRLIAHLPQYCGPWGRHTLLKPLIPYD